MAFSNLLELIWTIPLSLKRNTLDYFTKLLLSSLAPNILSKRHGGQPSSEWARFLHSHSFRLMTFFFICCPRMLKITCFLASLGWDSLWFNQIHNEALLAFRREHPKLQGCYGQGPGEGEEPLVLASHLEPGEPLHSHAAQATRVLPPLWLGILALPASVPCPVLCGLCLSTPSSPDQRPQR